MCQIISLPLPASKSSRRRSVTFAADAAGRTGGVMTVCQGRAVATYRLTEYAHVPYPARGFHAAKLAGGMDPEAAGYDVLIDPAGGHTCECKGHYRHGRCSHVDGILDLIAAGALDTEPVDAPAVPFPSPEQLAEDRDADLPLCFRGYGASVQADAF